MKIYKITKTHGASGSKMNQGIVEQIGRGGKNERNKI